MRKTKIVCTLGPATDDPAVLKAVMEAGMNVARFNFSHGSHEEHKKRMDLVKQLREELGLPIAILLDTKGPEIRLGKMKEGTFIENGQPFTLTRDDIIGDERRAPISYKDFYKDVVVGDMVLIDDGLISLRVESIDEKGDIHATVVAGGELKNNKGVNAPDIRINLPALTEQDEKDIRFGLSQGIDFIAPSFVRTKKDVLGIRRILEEEGCGHVQIISKIENKQGFENLEEILLVSDGIMVARGDLGVEMPIEEVPMAQKVMIKLSNSMGKPVITATQMLDSMMRNPTPTRAEATDVANAIFDGTDAIMLSGETAAGKFPVESVKTMAAIAMRTERGMNTFGRREYEKYHDSVTYAVSKASVEASHSLDTKGILTVTMSGFTARKIAMHRPATPVFAMTPKEETWRSLSLLWGVYPLMMEELYTTDEIFREMARVTKDAGYVDVGDIVIITSGIPLGVSGATNLMKVHVVGEIMQKGIGIGERTVRGRIRFAQNLHLEPLKEGDILYLDEVIADDLELVKKAAGLVIAEGGYTSLGAQWARELSIPAVLGVHLLRSRIDDCQEVRLDPKLGMIYNAAVDL